MTTTTANLMSYDQTLDHAKNLQQRADRYCLIGSAIIGTIIFGIFGLPFFLYGIWLLKKGEQAGLPVRPFLMTFVGYLVLVDGFLNSLGWIIDTFASHSLLVKTAIPGWGLLLDGGYAWQYNDLWVGGTAAPGEKAWEIASVFILFPIRIVAAWGFLQGKRWGLQWLVISCWIGLFAWVGYMFNMTVYWNVRFSDVAAPVWGWWLYDIWYVTPFILIPYLYTINKELFSDD